MDRLKTRIPDLDLVLGGGLEQGSVVIVAGAPGTGKTVLSQQIAFANAGPQRKAVYCTTFAEPQSKLVRHLEQFDFFDSKALGVSIDFLHLRDLMGEPGSDVIPSAFAEMGRVISEENPCVAVLDSAKALRDIISEQHLRAVYYELIGRVAHTDAVLLLLGEYTPDEMEGSAEFSLADAIIELAYESREPVDRRWLRVHKLRGGRHLAGKHSVRIDGTGLKVFPRLESLEVDGRVDKLERINSGIRGLDDIMGGGMASQDATVVLGPSGAGKTIFGLGFLQRALEQGERCLYISFQETGDELITKSSHFRWDMKAAREGGRIVIEHIPVGVLDLDVVGAVVRRALESDAIRRVVVDSLAEMVFAARESERFPAFARSLVGLIRAHGASLIVTSETTTLGPVAEPAGGLSYLFNNVILLRYIEIGAQIRRALNIVKMRNSDHEKGVFELVIDDSGISVGERLTNVTGVLGWSALRSEE